MMGDWKMKTLVSLLVLTLAFASGANALAERFSWQGVLVFEPQTPVPGGTLATLLAEIAGRDDLNGQLPLSGEVTYDLDSRAAAMNGNVAGFENAVLSSQLQFGVVPLAADMPRIALNADTSDIGVLAFENGAFCSDTEHCDALGVTGPSWGNMMLLHNSTGHFFIDETGTSNQVGDLFGHAVGRTDAPADYLPQIETRDHGIVAIDGLYLAFFVEPGREFLATHDRLPRFESLLEPGLIGRTEIALFLELPGIAEPIRIEGYITNVVPLP